MSESRERFEVRGSRFESESEAGADADGVLDAPTQTSNLEPRTSSVSRRTALKVLGAAPLVGVGTLIQQQQQQQQTRQTHEAPNQPARGPKEPPPAQPRARFFTPREMRTVRVLADDVIPADERSGSATDAKVPEFIDFNLSTDDATAQTRTQWRGGLRWLDAESRRRFGVAYAAAPPAKRHEILDDIAWPDRARPQMRYGATFFSRFRDMVAAGFFSSAIGFKDLQYIGNTFNPNWNGCPEPALRKLGVSYDVMARTVKPETGS